MGLICIHSEFSKPKRYLKIDPETLRPIGAYWNGHDFVIDRLLGGDDWYDFDEDDVAVKSDQTEGDTPAPPRSEYQAVEDAARAYCESVQEWSNKAERFDDIMGTGE